MRRLSFEAQQGRTIEGGVGEIEDDCETQS